MTRSFRRIPIGADAPHAVTLGIERNSQGNVVAAVWWPAIGDVDADEASYDNVEAALLAAEYARALHGFSEVVVTLQADDLWDYRFGNLIEPSGDTTNGVSSSPSPTRRPSIWQQASRQSATPDEARREEFSPWPMSAACD